MADYLGARAVNSTVRFSFTTHAASGAAVAPSSAFENADLRIYKDGSATQRTSANGITMTSPFDSVTGLHHVDIDLSDNTDAGFYAAGSFYEVHLVPDETVDSLAVVKVLAYFDIGILVVNVTQISGDATAADNAEAFFDGTGYAGTNNVIPTVTTATNVTTVNGLANNVITANSIAADAITDAKVAADVTIASVTGAVGSVTGNVGGNVNGDVVGSVGEVVGDVGGNLLGDVQGNVDGSIAVVGVGAIDTTSFAAGAIDASAIAANAIGASEIANDAITAAKIANGAIDAATFAADAITSTVIADDAITAGKIAANAITSSELAQSAAQEIADEILNRDLAGGASGDTRNVRNALRALRNRVAVAGGTATIYAEDDATPAWTAAVTTTAGDPISEVDPA